MTRSTFRPIEKYKQSFEEDMELSKEEIHEHLTVLEISEEISEVTKRKVNVSFRRLAKILHPDKSGDETTNAAFQKLRYAYMRDLLNILRIRIILKMNKKSKMKINSLLKIFISSIFLMKTKAASQLPLNVSLLIHGNIILLNS